MSRAAWLACVLVILASRADHAAAQQLVRFEADDGAQIVADLYAGGPRAVLLAHGGRYERRSWRTQAKLLSEAGFRVLALDFRGFGDSHGPGEGDPLSAPLHLDLLAAARFLRVHGARDVTVIGASLGGMAAGDALLSGTGDIDAVVFLGAPASLAGQPLARMPGRKLFIVARDDRNGQGRLRLAGIRQDFEQVPPPRELVVVAGAEHAQAMFEGGEAREVMAAIRRFLGDP